MEPNLSPQLVANPSDSGAAIAPEFVLDATDLSIVTANRAASAVFGYDPEHLVGAPIATLVVAPDELMIRDHIQAVAQHHGNGNGRLHAMIVHADGAVGSSHLAVTVEHTRPSVATVVVEVGTPATERTLEAPNGDGPDPGTAAWLVQQINCGVLAESEVGIALFHARTCRLVAGNESYARLAKSQHRRLVRTLTGGIAVDDGDARSIHAVRRGELAVYAGPAETPDATRGRYLVCGLGTTGLAPTYFTAYLYPFDNAVSTAAPGLDCGGDPAVGGELGLLAAVVDDEWRLRLIPRYSRVLGTPKELGESVVPLIHPRDLPRLLELGEGVRSGQVSVATMSLEARGADGSWAMIDVEITRVSGSDPAPWLAILYSPLPVDRGPAPEDWEPLLLLTHPELSSREREVARALLSGYRVTTIARHLFLSPSTVRNHLSSMFHKVGVVSQAELIERFHLLRSDPFP